MFISGAKLININLMIRKVQRCKSRKLQPLWYRCNHYITMQVYYLVWFYLSMISCCWLEDFLHHSLSRTLTSHHEEQTQTVACHCAPWFALALLSCVHRRSHTCLEIKQTRLQRDWFRHFECKTNTYLTTYCRIWLISARYNQVPIFYQAHNYK